MEGLGEPLLGPSTEQEDDKGSRSLLSLSFLRVKSKEVGNLICCTVSGAGETVERLKLNLSVVAKIPDQVLLEFFLIGLGCWSW